MNSHTRLFEKNACGSTESIIFGPLPLPLRMIRLMESPSHRIHDSKRDQDIQMLLEEGKVLDALNRLWERYKFPLANFLEKRHSGLTTEDIEEIVTDAFVQVNTYWEKGDFSDPLHWHLFKGAHNLAVDRYRRNSARKRGGNAGCVVLEEEKLTSNMTDIHRFEQTLTLFRRFTLSLNGQQKMIAKIMLSEVPGQIGPMHVQKAANQEGKSISVSSAKRALEEIRRKFRDFLNENDER